MSTLSEYELNCLIGGASISGTLLNSVSKLINTLLDLGRTIGSSIRYWKDGKSCSI